jgi:nitrogenase molybdenum-iron protein alpha/beta subunit
MAGLSDQIKKAQEVVSEEEIKKEVEQEVVKEQPKNLKTSVELSKDEITMILAKFAQLEFKGVEIELTYNLIVKLQNTYKKLLSK